MTVARLGALHAPPRWTVVMWEQVRATGLVMRTLGLLILPLFVVLGGAAIRTVVASHKLNGNGAGAAYLVYTPSMSVLFVFFALVLPLIVWQDEDPTRRLYHFAMPVSRVGHASLKSAAGLLWLMLGALLFLVGLGAVQAILGYMGLPQPHERGFVWWEWVVPFTSLTIAYMFASAAAVGTRRPVIWIFGPIALFALSGTLAEELGYHHLALRLGRFVKGYAGAGAALGGMVEEFNVATHAQLPSFLKWLSATAVWSAAGVAVFYLAARRRTDA